MPARRHSAWAFKLVVDRGGASQQTIVDELAA